MPLLWNSSRLRRCRTTSSSTEKAMSCSPASWSFPSWRTASTRGSAVEGGAVALVADEVLVGAVAEQFAVGQAGALVDPVVGVLDPEPDGARVVVAIAL